MDFIGPIVSPIVQSLLLPIKKHLGFLISSTKNVKDMNSRMKQLNDTARELQNRWDMAVAKTEVVPERVEPWLEDVKMMNESARSIQTNATRCFNVSKRYKAGKRSYEILKEIENLEIRESKIKFTNEKKSLAKVRSTPTRPSTSGGVLETTQNNFQSRDLLFKEVLKCLQLNNESQQLLALCGMGGVGKTTMMEQLKKAVEDSKMFDWVVKVVLGENTDPIALQRAIAEYIGEDLTEKSKDARADRLRTSFEGMSKQGKKKILVIMDDVWKEVDLKDIGLRNPLPNGFKLLFTSRFEYVCTQMGVRPDSIFRVDVLNDTEARILFFGIVGPSILDGNDPEIPKIGENIVKKCGGLPIAIVTIAKSLRCNIKEAWEEALSNLQHHDLQDLDDLVHKVFEMSYNNLKRRDDKELFLLSGLFPDDFDISVEDLMRYGWGLQLFTKVNSLAEARRRTNICVNNLIRANLLIESERMGYVRMHDLIRAFILSNFSKVKQASICNHDYMSIQQHTRDANESYERVLLRCKDMLTFPADFCYPNLSLLILMDGDIHFKFPEDICQSMEKLKVVSFENISIPLLPIMFEHSTKLRTLCLHSCSFMNDDISFIGSLCNLEILSFSQCQIRRLPLMIGKLKKLKSLELTKCADLCIDNGVFQNLESLEELYMRADYNGPFRLTDTNCEELEILSRRLFALELEFHENKIQPKKMSFRNLERFKICIGCKSEYYERYSLRNTLDVVADREELLECKINELFEKVEELKLQVNNMSQLEDVSIHHSFSNLRVLHVSHCADLTYLFTIAVASGLNKLEWLTISRCPVLRTLVGENSGVAVVKFQKLKFMSLEGLPMMVNLFDNVIELPEMLELRVDALPNFASIYPDDSNDTFEMQSLLNSKVVIPKLEKLVIFRMQNLKQIWPCQLSLESNISTLRQLCVRECHDLVNLFPSNPLLLISHLEELEIVLCGSIEVLFNIDFEIVCEMERFCSSRLRSINLDTLGKLKVLWRMSGVNSCDICINCFKGLESIQIRDCISFSNIFTPTDTNFDLASLATYITRNIGQETNAIMEEEITELDDYNPNDAYPYYLLHAGHNLQRLRLENDKRVNEVVFEMDSHSTLLLPNLMGLHLSYLWELSHVWKCNWNKFLTPQHQPLQQFPFQNLADIYLVACPKIKYLFSPLMAKYLSTLKYVTIHDCYSFKEVMSSRDDENEANTASSSSYRNTTLFPHLDALTLRYTPCLTSIDGFQSCEVTSARWSLCQYPKTISIQNCDAMSSLIPWYAAGQMNKLQELEIDNCGRMMKVFDEESAHGTTMLTSPMLGSIITRVPQLSNLKRLYIVECNLLPHIFAFSTLECLKQLKDLVVRRCKAIQVIVKEENGIASGVVAFPCLQTLILDDLPSLEGFFLGMNDFRWPVLKYVTIDDCPQLVAFTSGESKTPKLEYIRTSLGKHSLDCGLNFHGMINYNENTSSTSSHSPISRGLPWSFHNLTQLKLYHTSIETVIPCDALLKLQKLETISINSCHNIKELFKVDLEVINNSGCSESQTLPNLRKVKLKKLNGLKYLWKRNQWMALKFPNLTKVNIYDCDSLEHVFTCSMVASLVQLQDLQITYCKNIEVIVKEDAQECDAKVNEIVMLPRLKTLLLHSLPSFKGFCLGNEAFSWPLFDDLRIYSCPAITFFTKGHLTTPKLKEIHTNFGVYNVTDLNSFTKTKQEEGHEF